jgi:hypothetical protein
VLLLGQSGDLLVGLGVVFHQHLAEGDYLLGFSMLLRRFAHLDLFLVRLVDLGQNVGGRWRVRSR